MNSSENLISLSDSGVGSVMSASFSSPNCHFIRSSRAPQDSASINGVEPKARDAVDAEVLIDLTDAVQIPLPSAILTQAEVDDTFGIYSQATDLSDGNKIQKNDQDTPRLSTTENEASKLVRSFTCGGTGTKNLNTLAKKSVDVDNDTVADSCSRYSDIQIGGTSTKKHYSVDNACEVGTTPDLEDGKISQGSTNRNTPSPGTDNDRDSTCSSSTINASDQPTVVESDDSLNITGFIGFPVSTRTIIEQQNLSKRDLSSHLSGGSDSDILDINNLSSFSLPDNEESIDENYLKNIKTTCPEGAESASFASGIIGRIKQEILQNEMEIDDDDISKGLPTTKFELVPNPDSDVLKPKPVANRLSTRSDVSTSTRLSSVSDRGDGYPIPNENEVTSDNSNSARIPRLSLTGLVGSPIRASYPVSKYFMPTPKTTTPAMYGHKNRNSLKPNETPISLLKHPFRNIETSKSPRRMPARKSLSLEALYTGCVEEISEGDYPRRNTITFSTPAPKGRHSFTVQSRVVETSGLFSNNILTSNDDRVEFHHGDWEAVNAAGGFGGEAFSRPRITRLSVQSTSSTASSYSSTGYNTLSPTHSTRSSVGYSRDLVQINKQIAAISLNQTKPNESTHTVQPLRATAIVPPTSHDVANRPILSKPRLKTATTTSDTNSQKFIPPIATSSPKILPSPKTATTPSRNRPITAATARSSGYGPRQNLLNSTFQSKPPLTSPNKIIPPDKAPPPAKLKPAAIPKPIKFGVPQVTAKSQQMNTVNSATVRSGGAAAGVKKVSSSSSVPTAAANHGALRRPAPVGNEGRINKENNSKISTARFGFSKPRQ